MIKVLAILFMLFSISNAHKLNVFTNFEDNTLYVNAYFANGNACQNCKLKILKDDKLILENKTNEKGEFEVKTKLNSFVLSLDAGSGHVVLKDIKKDISKQIKSKKNYEDTQLEKLQKQNEELKLQIKLLEEKLSYFEFFKIVFALLVIFGIFAFLKRVKKS